MTITNFDKQNLKSLRSDIDKAIKEVADKHGISLSIGSISFTQDRFTTRLTALTKSSTEKSTSTKINTGTITNPAAFQFSGFKIGDKFKHNTKLLKVVGYNPRKPKNCVELVDQNGKKFNGSLEMVSKFFTK